MSEQRDCRVLIIDDYPEEAAAVATALAEIRPPLINHNQLQIELTNTAYFVAERLRDCPPGNPPWDIIISDVFMPIPSNPLAKDVPIASATKTTYKFEGKDWPYWEYQYSWNSKDPRIAHGGFHVAGTIKKLQESNKDLGNLKLILISSVLFGEERELLDDFTVSDRNWLEYHDKSVYEGDATRETWPKHNLRRDIFKWALIQAISKRDSQYWGDAILNIIPNAQDYLLPSQSPSMQVAEIVARRLGGSLGVRTVLITGEIATGKEVIANIVNFERGQALGRALGFVKVDCSTIPPEQFASELFGSWDERRGETLRRGLVDRAAGGTLYFKDLDLLPLYQQGKLVTLMKDGTFRREQGTENLPFVAELIICSMTKDPGELFESGAFHPDVYFELKDSRIDLPPLRERRDDIVPLAERAISRTAVDVHLTPEAESWLRAQPWPGNVRDLMNTVASAARQSTSASLPVADLEAIVAKGRPAMVQTNAVENTPDNLFQKRGDFWFIAYQGKSFTLKDQKGLHYIAWLLAHPAQEFHVLELKNLTEKQQAGVAAREYEKLGAEQLREQGIRVAQLETDPTLDPQYKADLKRELKELQDQLDYAEQVRDASLARKLQSEIEFIGKTLVSNTGLGGRERRDPTEPRERARLAILNSYTRTLRAIGKNDEELWRHLYNSIHKGEFLSYTPEQLPDWTL